eukprot:scaffold74136_cov22-Cyclotella_meneghiniana.AAC.1
MLLSTRRFIVGPIILATAIYTFTSCYITNNQLQLTAVLHSSIEINEQTQPILLRSSGRRLLDEQQYLDPRTVTLRTPQQPLTNQDYKVNPLIKPDGYPWHRWPSASSSYERYHESSYPLNVLKFVSILERLGRGENELLGKTLHPRDYVTNNSLLTMDTIRIHGSPVQVFLLRNGTVLRSKGSTGAFVSLVQHAIHKAYEYVHLEPGLKLLTEGDFPLIYDPNDYPWCGDDLVPIFRLNAIKSKSSCMHSWPVLSLTYFNEATNIQLLESPYGWDRLMMQWDQSYPWHSKIPKVVWRGRLTGYTYNDGERPRQKLMEYVKDYTHIMDIQVSSKYNLIAQDDFQQYMAVLDIDGNAWSARFAKLLCYNSVVIKIEPTYVGYWDKEVEPFVHYLPVKADFSNLEETVRYVINPINAEHVASIVKNAQ